MADVSPIRPDPSRDITALLYRWDGGDADARDALFDLLYEDLRRLARAQRLRRRPHHTLNTTALVHEVYLKLAEQADIRDREHFMALVSKALRCVLVDYARRVNRQKRGGGAHRIDFDEEALPGVEAEAADLLTLNEALDRLAELDVTMAQTVEMHFFAGLSYEEIADARGISRKTVYRTVLKAKALLRQHVDR